MNTIDLDKEVFFDLIKNYNYRSSEISFNNINNDILEVFIYASGKTGSTSVFESFCKLNRNCIHLHTTKYFTDIILKKKLPDNFKFLDYVNFLAKHKKNIIIIDIVREPISRKISSFFQRFERLDFIQNRFDSPEESVNYYLDNIAELVELFNKYYLIQQENYYSFDEYRDDNLNIREMKFNHNKHRIWLKHNEKRYLIIRFEDIKLWNDIFRDIGFEEFELSHVNKAEDKLISALYNAFKNNYFLSKESLDEVYHRKHKSILEQFYTENQREKMYNKWLLKVK